MTTTIATAHTCDAACAAAAEVECGCSSAPTPCEDCTAFFALHPDAL